MELVVSCISISWSAPSATTLTRNCFMCVVVKPFSYNPEEELFVVAPLHTLPPAAWVAAAGLGFSLSLLFFMDQNISSALVNTPAHK